MQPDSTTQGDLSDESGFSDDVTAPESRADEVEDLGDLRSIAEDIFRTWYGGTEIEWAEYAWACLGSAGLTRFDTEIERARVVCRLLALAALAREFYARAYGEGYPGEHPFSEDDVLGPYPRIDPFVLGQLAERDGVDTDIEFGYDFEEGVAGYALREIVRAQCRTVAQTLTSRWGSALSFASLWASANDDTKYPLADDVVRDIVNVDITNMKMDGWHWIEEGMPVG
ncbi:hypothetical protein [Kribbella sp. VKM Ac-2568]|uniref:hypothetical protein n=1 Tax=Kribbella sp. VKM Ac-2568 TaxID=2512219 RepID=UPI00104CE850|nr:hypothetical protein [Kribbella sp. VKM Ac-2568]TCM45226.1 hypothetical protein EV648_107379 [Kribbella sp. VKM Ac-2568]